MWEGFREKFTPYHQSVIPQMYLLRGPTSLVMKLFCQDDSHASLHHEPPPKRIQRLTGGVRTQESVHLPLVTSTLELWVQNSSKDRDTRWISLWFSSDLFPARRERDLFHSSQWSGVELSGVLQLITVANFRNITSLHPVRPFICIHSVHLMNVQKKRRE